ncbi:DctP family TRAP transporter solute-binding subunit [Thermovorax subterraneus]|nr:DctP family TRAP transporter solute-binding subunit [Thermovorax subterraneus]
MKKIRLLSLMLVLILTLSLILSGCGGAKNSADNTNTNEQKQDGGQITLKVAHIFAPTHPANKGLEKFAELVAQKTNGKVKVDIYHSGVLGGDTEELQQVIAGSLDAAIIMGIDIWQGMDKRAAVEGLPFLFKDEKHAHAALDGEFGELLKKEVLEPTGVKVLAFWENGFRHFTNNKRPIRTPEDMKGIKFRSSQSPIRIKMFNVLGSSAIPIAFPELYTALQQGTVDGQENPLPVIESSRFYEVQKYLSLSGHLYNAGVFIINPKVWESYPEDVKKAIQEAAIEARDYERKLNSEENDKIIERLKAAGMQVNEIDRESFVKAVQPIWEDFKKEFGSELVDAALKYAN